MAATGAFAQSSVTLFGVADVGFQSAKQGDNKINQLSSSGNASSRIGFRGTEDLGGGLSASFHFEAGLQVDNPTPIQFTRRSTVDLAGGFGAVRLGRDYTPTFWNHTVFDPFGTLGSGAGSNITGVGQNATTGARTSNGISYLYGFAPNAGSNVGASGVYVQATYAPGEVLNKGGASATVQAGQYMGIRGGYTAGPLNLAVATSTTQTATDGVKDKETNFGAAYDVGVANLMFKFGTNTAGLINAVAATPFSLDAATGAIKGNAKVDAVPTTKYTWMSIGATVPMGQGYIPVSYNTSKNDQNSDKGSQLAVGYVYDLSKRTALYTTYSHITNNGNANYTFKGGNGGFVAGVGSAGKSGTAYDFGIRHSF